MQIDWGDLEDFCRYNKNPPLSESTISKHRRTFNRVSPYIEEHGWGSSTVLNYIKFKRAEGLKNKSLNDYRKFFAVLDLFLKTDYAKAVRRMQEEATDFDVISKEEKVAIITCYGYGTTKNEHLYSILYFLLSELALRIEEALSLTSFDCKGDYITIHSTKTNRYDDLPISGKLQKALATLPQGKLFPFVQQSVGRDLHARTTYLGIKKRVTTHTFRRSYVTQALDDGIPEQWLIQMTRHSSTASLQPYQKKAKKYKQKVMRMHSFTIDSMSLEDKISYAIEEKRKFEDTLRALNLPKEELEKLLLITSL